MAESGRRSNSRGSFTKFGASNPQNDASPSPARQPSDILSREEEYKRLNAELEKKTASLVQEAEMVMREQENVLSKSRYLDNINTEDFLEELEDGGSAGTSKRRTPHEDVRPPSKNSRPGSAKKPPSAGKKKSKTPSSAAEDVAVADDTFMTSLYQQFSDMSSRYDTTGEGGELGGFGGADVGGDDDEDDDDVLPQAAADMGSEASIRFLKAKLRVMQEELDRLAHENHKKDEENRGLGQKVKDAEEERNRLLRTSSSQQQQIDKHKKLAEEARGKTESLENQLSALRKEVEQMKRSQKQQQTSQSATEVRLNRALEDIERYREQLQRTKSASKDHSDADKHRVEQLLAQNKRLEKQKSELMAGFRKQMKLIDILKRQKMHIEAAKMMQFSEEEFVKALEWGS
ncbi:testis-expressed protein 9 [Aplysia californica]|uniref:Testis-expressed protein 9 n=1 Tax=Aplysia californica TaxID=6500 RepID=A0ABM1A7Q3_APLCA|nr:testis-expressed protein 9 [Aplysia californica]